MNPPAKDPTVERIAASILAIFFGLFGWFTLGQGGVTLKGKSGATSFVNGWAGIAVAGLAFMVATFGVTLFLHSFKTSRSTYYFCWAILLLPPLAYVFLHS